MNVRRLLFFGFTALATLIAPISPALAATPAMAASAVPRPPSAASVLFPKLFPALVAVNVDQHGCLAARGRVRTAPARCATSPQFLWRVAPVTLDARFQLQNLRTGRCLTAADTTAATGAAAAGVPVVQSACDDALARQWRFRDAPGRGVYVVNAKSGKCLSVARGRAVQAGCDSRTAVRWSFRERPNGPGVIRVRNGRP